MKSIIYFIVFLCLTEWQSVFGDDKVCSDNNCKEPKCECFSHDAPYNHTKADIPQFIIMTFDEAVRYETQDIYLGLSKYKNPNGCPIQATFFASHVDTNYKLVNELHRRGHEIGAHSITKNSNQEHWKKLDLEGWRDEFGGVKKIISKLADIPIDEIVGARAPQLQTAGNITFTAFSNEGFKYDCSQPSRLDYNAPLFPYTLDFGFKADCQIQPCMTAGQDYPSFWSVPMNDWITEIPVTGGQPIKRPCASVDACILYDKKGEWITTPSVDDLVTLFEDNFNRFYESNRAPFPLFLRDSWFSFDSKRKDALIQFIEKVIKKPDVYFVSISEVVDWMGRGVENTETKNYKQKVCVKDADKLPESKCGTTDIHTTDGNCKFEKTPLGQSKVVVICNNVKCPDSYPWLKNN